MAKLRQKIPAVVKALKKTQQRYMRNLHSNLDTRNKRVRVGDFVYTTNHQQRNKLQSRTVGDCPPSLQDDDTPPAPFTQGVGSEPNGLLLPSVHDLTTMVEDLMYQSTEATLIAPRWEGAPWESDAKRPVHGTMYCLTRQTTTMVRPLGHLLPINLTRKPTALHKTNPLCPNDSDP